MTTKINLALSEFSTLPFDTTGTVKKDIDFNNKKIFNLETDTVLGKSAANVKFVQDSIKSIIFPINMNTNAIKNLPAPSSLADAATKKYVDDTSSPENILKKISGNYRGTVMLDSDKKLEVNISNHFTVDEYGVIFVDPQFLLKRDAALKPNGNILDANKKLALNLNPIEFYTTPQGRVDFLATSLIKHVKPTIDIDATNKLHININTNHLEIDADGKLNVEPTTSLQNYAIGSGILVEKNTISVKPGNGTIDVNSSGVNVNITNLTRDMIKLYSDDAFERNGIWYTIKKDEKSITTDFTT